MQKLIYILFLFSVAIITGRDNLFAQAGKRSGIVVDKSGKGDFTSIQAAINSLDDSASGPRVIYIKRGSYPEKLYIAKANVRFVGEDREHTIITASIARDEWRCLHNDDWGVATINIEANDISLENLTVVNGYGFGQPADRVITCPRDTLNPQKKITSTGHQMALRTFQCTRLKVVNCILKAFGGDTVSPWNTAGGMFYFRDCTMEGGVDFYCPRGWAYAENCRFIAHSGPASIWHDGSQYEDAKTVLKNCRFEGFHGFKLGRYHRDAQFYLINCRFAADMTNEDIYLVPTSNTLKWGRRVFYYNCHRDGGDYSWFADNLDAAPGKPDPGQINVAWVFGSRWQPDIK